jgi:hypothetical protein
MAKLNVIKIVMLLLIVAAIPFYWYQVRPASIRHDCSWILDHHEKQQAITQSDINNEIDKYCTSSSTMPSTFSKLNCDAAKSTQLKAEMPASDYYRKASENEYKFCLHERGL